MKEKRFIDFKGSGWIIGTTVLLIIGFISLAQWRSGLAVVDFPSDFKVGDSFSGKLTIGIEEEDSIPKDTGILIALSKGEEIVASETLTFEEFIALSEKEAPLTLRNGLEYYETPGSYSVDMEKIIDYEFMEKGEYEAFLSVLKLDLTFRKKFYVD